MPFVYVLHLCVTSRDFSPASYYRKYSTFQEFQVCTYHKISVNIDGTKEFGGRVGGREEGREPHSPLRNRVSNGSQT
jgi:hypothetical protein